jgi:hypothetical protein
MKKRKRKRYIINKNEIKLNIISSLADHHVRRSTIKSYDLGCQEMQGLRAQQGQLGAPA